MMNRTGIFFTSDWHIGHAAVLKPDFDDRPFQGLNHMHTSLVNNYNATVPENAVCFFLGDMGMAKSDIVRKTLSRLNGSKKICVIGNHDKGVEAFYKVGFDCVIYSASLIIAKKRVTMSHCPLRGVWREDITGMKNAKEGESWHGESRHDKYTITDEGQYHLHGHTHKKPKERILDRQFDVGVLGNGYRPVNISKIESWIAKRENR